MSRPALSIAAAALALLAATAPARALEPLGERGLAVVNGGGGEFFVTPVPIDWQVAHSQMDGRVLNMAWLPEGQSVGDWQDKVTLMVFPGETEIAGRELLAQLTRRYRRDCAELQTTDTQVQQKQGHTVAFRFVGCTKHRATDQGELALFRAVEGDGSLYLVQRAWRTPPYGGDSLPFQRELLGKTRLWLQGGRICKADSVDPERACPPRLADAIQRTSLDEPVTVVRLDDGGSEESGGGADE